MNRLALISLIGWLMHNFLLLFRTALSLWFVDEVKLIIGWRITFPDLIPANEIVIPFSFFFCQSCVSGLKLTGSDSPESNGPNTLHIWERSGFMFYQVWGKLILSTTMWLVCSFKKLLYIQCNVFYIHIFIHIFFPSGPWWRRCEG